VSLVPVTGTLMSSATAVVSVVTHAAGNAVILFAYQQGSTAITATGVSGGGCTWAVLSAPQVATVHGGTAAVFIGTCASPGTANATVTYTGGAPTTTDTAGLEFAPSGAISVDVAGFLDNAGTSNSALPSLTPAGGAAGEAYVCLEWDTVGAVAGTTSGFTYALDAFDGYVYNANCTGGTQSPVMGDSTVSFGIALLLKTAPAVVPALPSRVPPGRRSPVAWQRAVPPSAPPAPPAPAVLPPAVMTSPSVAVTDGASW